MTTNALTVERQVKALADLVDEMLRHMGAAGRPARAKRLSIKASVFDRCIQLCRAGAPEEDERHVRSVHHLSCTGGTLITKCLATAPNTLVLNEVDPLSKMLVDADRPSFQPTDLAALSRMGDKTISDSILSDMFLRQIRVLHEKLRLEGRRLLVRDHSHGQFLFFDEPGKRPTLLELLRRELSTLSIVTVRDPVDSYLALKTHGWVIFTPATLDEYCRRYVMFLDAHEGVPIHRYEDFLAEPHAVMKAMCADLMLPFNELFEETFDAFRLSGDSGRADARIAARPRREYTPELIDAAKGSLHYHALCDRLGYEPLGGRPRTRPQPPRRTRSVSRKRK